VKKSAVYLLITAQLLVSTQVLPSAHVAETVPRKPRGQLVVHWVAGRLGQELLTQLTLYVELAMTTVEGRVALQTAGGGGGGAVQLLLNVQEVPFVHVAVTTPK
jgi:hypothetical protein